MATLAKLALMGCGVVMVGILSDAGGRTALAQSNPEAPKVVSQDQPSFEVASVRRAPGRDPFFVQMRPPRALASGRFDATATLRSLIQWAFRPEFPIEGSFRELDDEFVIAAKAPGPVLLAGNYEVGPMNQMLQSLLAERFKLQVRWETRTFPVYALRRTTTERLGPNLKRIDTTCPQGYPEVISAAPEGCMSRVSMGRAGVRGVVRNVSEFARMLSIFAGRRVVDDTGLVGPFELSTAFDFSSETGRSPFPSENTENLPSLRDALQRDLGFKLEADQRDFPVLIVEHVEQPTEN
jgi:uncharacterized protein (TIGR03435 family)